MESVSGLPSAALTDENRGSCAILREHSRFICCGDALAGKIMLRDPQTLKVQHTLDAHSGALSDFDVHGHHLVSFHHSFFLLAYDLNILPFT